MKNEDKLNKPVWFDKNMSVAKIAWRCNAIYTTTYKNVVQYTQFYPTNKSFRLLHKIGWYM